MKTKHIPITAALALGVSVTTSLNARAAALYDYTTIDHPLGVGGTRATGILGDSIVGNYTDASNITHGFLLSGNAYTAIEHPLGAKGTWASGISDGTIVGYYQDASSNYHGFLFSGITYTTFDDPSSAHGTFAYGISGSSVVGNS